MQALLLSARSLYFGWWLVGGTMVMQLFQALLFYNAFGLYVVALTQEFGWSITLLTGGYALLQLLSGLLAPVQGMLLDRFGPRRVVVFGTLAFASGLFMLAATSTLVGFYAALMVIGLGASLGGYLSLTTAVVPWFERRRALAMSLMAVGASIGGALVPIMAVAVTNFGWRTAAFASAWVVLGLSLPFTALLRRDPQRYGLEVDGAKPQPAADEEGPRPVARRDRSQDFTLRQALRTRAFWMIGVGHGAALLVVSSVIVHLIPHLTRGLGFSLTASASVLAALTVVTAVAQLFGGALGDRFPKHLISLVAMIMHMLGLLSLVWLPASVGVALFLVLHGLAWGIRGPLMAAIRADYFGRAHFGAILGASTVVFMVGQLAGPITAALMADAFGDYRLAFTVLALLAGLGSLAFFFATPPLHPSARDAAPKAAPQSEPPFTS